MTSHLTLRVTSWIALCVALLAFNSCQTTTSSHQFADPSPSWSTKSGQLAYTDQKMSLIGEVLVRYSKQRDFELTFTKAGGISLLSLRQDARFGKVEGPLARRGWSGPLADAPPRLRGWFQLRDKIVNGRRGATLRHESGEQTFSLRF